MWKPILSRDLLLSAETIIDEVTSDLCNRGTDQMTPSETAETALLFGYLALASGEHIWRDRAIGCLTLAIERISNERGYSSALHGGLSGIGWTIEHLSLVLAENGPGAMETEDPVQEIDDLLVADLERRLWLGSYRLIDGLVGIGVYFLERLPSHSASKGIRLVLRQLEKHSEYSWGGLTWFTPSHKVPACHKEAVQSGYYDLGIGYGIPGVIQFLGEVLLARIEEERVYRLLSAAIDWLLARECPPGAPSRYGPWFIPGEPPRQSPLAWSYGDLGVATTLHHTGSRVGREDWRDYGQRLFDRCLEAGVQEKGITDATLCQGAFGIAHIFNRMYHRTGHQRYYSSANAWYGKGISVIQHKDKTNRPDLSGRPSMATFVPGSYLISGPTGVGLALLAAIYPLEPAWDRLLMLSGCERSWW